MVESVAVTVSGGGTTAGPGSSHRDSELLAPHSLSFSSPFHLCFSVFACTSHESPCVMSSLIPPPLHAHIPYCILLLSGPGSDCLKTHAPFPPSPHFCILPRIEYSSLQFHFDILQNDISSNVIMMY